MSVEYAVAPTSKLSCTVPTLLPADVPLELPGGEGGEGGKGGEANVMSFPPEVIVVFELIVLAMAVSSARMLCRCKHATWAAWTMGDMQHGATRGRKSKKVGGG